MSRCLAVLLLFLSCVSSLPAQAPIRLYLDASDAPRKILHARMTIPARPGPLTLVYPKWIPGEHGPTGPIANVAGQWFKAGGKEIEWKRDGVDMYAYHLDVPAGVTEIEAQLDFLEPASTEGFSSTASSTAQLIVVSWNQVLLYPQGVKSDDARFTATLKLPKGWKYATSLPAAPLSTRVNDDETQFSTVSLTTLVDSPVLAGAFLRRDELAPDVYLNIAADSSAALDMTPEQLLSYKNLVAEANALWGAHHYRQYNFLYTLSDYVAHFGLEHHESSDDRMPERSLVDYTLSTLAAGLLPHEMTHSWNGKYRRPAGLATPDYQQPMRGELLWVYEGLTNYIGEVLTARSGLWGLEMAREHLAYVAAQLDHRPGRQWRPLGDTAVAAQLLYDAPNEWANWRRGVDYYDEGTLIWLEADTVIRKQTHNQKSLDDFCRWFGGAPSGPPMVKTYTIDDIVTGMNMVAPYDWRAFFQSRIDRTTSGAPLGGITGGGWKLVYNFNGNEYGHADEFGSRGANFVFSLGLDLKDDGTVRDIVNGAIADKVGLAPGMKVIAVNGRRWSGTQLHNSMVEARRTRQPIEMIVENNEFYKTYTLAYYEGDLQPHLERDRSQEDLLTDIFKAKTN
jgi:predicted metalloprotease with PDZ domain